MGDGGCWGSEEGGESKDEILSKEGWMDGRSVVKRGSGELEPLGVAPAAFQSARFCFNVAALWNVSFSGLFVKAAAAVGALHEGRIDV